MASRQKSGTSLGSGSGRSTPTSENSGDSNVQQKQSAPDSPPLPSINERLGHLRPSRELLEYYRKKIAEYDGEHEDMMAKLDLYKMTYEEQQKVTWEQRQREEEIAELQKALSDMQVYLFQEREHVLRLYAENDRLKIRELEDRKKIQTLLMLSGLTEREVSYFMKEPPARAIIEQKLPTKLKNSLEKDSNTKVNNLKKSAGPTVTRNKLPIKTEEEEKYMKDNQTLQLQVEALQAQLEEQTKLAKEQVDALLEDRRVRIEEFETRRQRDEDKIKTLTDKLHKTQDLLYDSTKDFLAMRYEGRAQERHWMGEKDKLLHELDRCHSEMQLRVPAYRQGSGTAVGTSTAEGGRRAVGIGKMIGPDGEEMDVLHVDIENLEGRTRKDEEIQGLEYQLKQAHKLADMYRDQVIQLEEKLSGIREQEEVGKQLFKDRSEKMSKRLGLMNQRYQDLEKRRNLEVEGFKTDIKHLRQRLKELEKQLFKVTLGLSEGIDETRPEDIDLLILRNVRQTAGRSKHLMGELKGLKAKVYGLENDLRHL